MSFKEYLESRLANAYQKRPATFLACWLAFLLGLDIGFYKLLGYLTSISPTLKTFLTLLGIPALFGLVLLILYIIWKAIRGLWWLMDQPSYGRWVGRVWVPDPFMSFLHTIANNKIVINIEVEKKPEEEKQESQDATPSSTSGQDA